MVTKIHDGANWKNINGLKLYNGTAWKNATKGWIWNGSLWKQWYPEYPINTASPTVSGSTTQGQTLSVTNGSWNTNLAYAPTSYTYQWKRAGSNISGATSSTYTTVVADIGNSITCTVTAVNNRGTLSANSSNGITIVASTYTLTYNGNGGIVLGNSSTSTTVTAGSAVSLPSATRNYHTFNGWYTAASGGTYLGTTGNSYTPPSTTTIYAQWSAISYTVSFNANGGSVSPTSSSGTNSGGLTLPTPSRTNYSFLGWYDASSGGNYVGGGGSAYYPTSSITLYAQWQIITYTVYWNGNGGTVDPSSSTVNAGSAVTAPSPSRSGYVCTGWWNSTSGGTKIVDVGNSYTPSSSVNLYAQWTLAPIVPTISSLSITNSSTLTYVNWTVDYQDTYSISVSPATGGVSGGTSFSGTADADRQKYIGTHTPGTTYSISLTVTSSTGHTDTESTSWTAPGGSTAPSTPTGVGLTGSGSVSWTGDATATSYEIEFYTATNTIGSGAAGPYSVTGISASPYQLTSPYASPNNYARVRVRARNSAGASSYSDWVPSATTYT
jgi:uncharacterized repeat protein (TIGR02543 family)